MDTTLMTKLLKTFNFDAIEVSDLNQAQKNFYEAVKAISSCSHETAVMLLDDLCESCPDQTLKNYASNLLFQQLFWNDEFDRIQALALNDCDAIDASYRLIARKLVDPANKVLNYLKDKQSIDLKLSISGSPIVDLVINGVKKSFWLDTGALMSAVSSQTADLCNIDLESGDLALDTSTDMQLTSKLGKIHHLSVANMTLENIYTIVLPTKALTISDSALAEDIKIDGIIGWDIIKHMDLTIDYKNMTVDISKPTLKPSLEKNIIMDGYVLVKMEALHKTPLYFGLDTGANRTSFSDPFLEKMNIETVNTKTGRVAGIGGFKNVDQKSLPEIEFIIKNKTFKVTDVTNLAFTPCDFFDVDGLLASDIAQKGKMHIDFTNRFFDISLS